MARKTYTLEERLQAVKAHLEQGKSIWVIAAEKQAEETTVRTWIKKYQAMGIAGLFRRDISGNTGQRGTGLEFS